MAAAAGSIARISFSGQTLSGQTLSGQILSGQILSGQILPGQILSGQILSGQACRSGRTRGQELARLVPPDLADRFARTITICASAYLFVRIGMGLIG